MFRPRAPSLRRYAILQADLANLTGLSADDTVDLGGYGSRMDGGEGELLAVDSTGLTADEGELFASGTAGIMLRRQRAVATAVNSREFGILPGTTGTSLTTSQFGRLRKYLQSISTPATQITLNIPFAHYAGRLNIRSIRNLVVNGNGCWFGGLQAQVMGIPNYTHNREGSTNGNLPFLIELPSIGATTLTATDADSRQAAQIGKIETILDAGGEANVLIYSGDKQDLFGYPPNFRSHEWHRVSAADATAGTVTLAGDGIRYAHTLRGLAVRCMLYDQPDVSELGIFPVWSEHTYNDLNVKCTSGNYITIGGGVHVVNDCTLDQASGDFAWLTAGRSFAFTGCTFKGSWEPDKVIEDVTCTNCDHQWTRIFGSGITNWTDTGASSTYTGSWSFFGPVHYRRIGGATSGNGTTGLGFAENYIWQDALITGGTMDIATRAIRAGSAYSITDFDFTDNGDGTGVLSYPEGRFLEDLGNGINNIINVGSTFTNPKLGYRLTATDVASGRFDSPRLGVPVTIERLNTGAAAAYGIPDYASRDPDRNDWLLISVVGYFDTSGVENTSRAGAAPNGGTIDDPTIVSRGWVYNPYWRRSGATSFDITLWPGDAQLNIEVWPIIDAVVTSISVTVTGAVGNVASDEMDIRLATNATRPARNYPGKGTITASGSTTVTGTGTLFSRFRADDVLILDSDDSEHTIASVESETSLTLDSSATFTGESFVVIERNSINASEPIAENIPQISLWWNDFRQITTVGTIDTGTNGTTTFSDINTYAQFLHLGRPFNTVDGKMVVTVNLAEWGTIPE